VHVTVPRRAAARHHQLLVEADQRHQLLQHERITLALVAQTESVSAAELAEEQELPDAGVLRPWLEDACKVVSLLTATRALSAR